MREQVELLEDHPDLRPQPVERLPCPADGLPVEAHLAFVDRLQPVDAAQHRRLARARRSGDDHDLTAVDRQVDPVQHDVVPEALANRDAARRGAAGPALPVRSSPVHEHTAFDPTADYGCGNAFDRRPLLRRVLRPPDGPPARGAAPRDAQGGRLGARPRRRRRLQAAQLDDAADGHRGGGRGDRRPQAQGRGPAGDHPARGAGRRGPPDGRGRRAAGEGRRGAGPAGAAGRRAGTAAARASGWCGASGRPTSGPST